MEEEGAFESEHEKNAEDCDRQEVDKVDEPAGDNFDRSHNQVSSQPAEKEHRSLGCL